MEQFLDLNTAYEFGFKKKKSFHRNAYTVLAAKMRTQETHTVCFPKHREWSVHRGLQNSTTGWILD